MSRFDDTLFLDRWKNVYANNSFTIEPWPTIESNNTIRDACINVQDELPQTKILSEDQKYKKALKTAQSLASVASEGGMKTSEAMMQMQALLESWQTGKPFHLIDANMHSIPKNVS